MNERVPYQKKSVSWSYVLLLKTKELAQYLVEKKKAIDFNKPEFTIDRQDSVDIRQKILNIS
jgi:CRISPR-associated protein Cas1